MKYLNYKMKYLSYKMHSSCKNIIYKYFFTIKNIKLRLTLIRFLNEP
jgi:hypothetical protein